MIILAFLLSADSSEGTTQTFVTAILVKPNILRIFTGTHLSWFLETEFPGAGSTILGAPAGVATIHMGVGLPDIVEHSQVINTLVGLSRPLDGRLVLLDTELLSAGTSCLQTATPVATILTDVIVTNLVPHSSNIFALI